MKNLRFIELDDNPVKSLEPLSTLQKLCTMDCSYTFVESLEPLRNLPMLQTLDCNSCKYLRDIESVKSLPNLESFLCCDCPIDEKDINEIPDSVKVITDYEDYDF
ncbi:MAG: hypothetical protein EOL87_14470 [Spartobacteria bacterium]|nr:hypothetical protein [Spartobacteria bacterium]